jgi:hypothetical protein
MTWSTIFSKVKLHSENYDRTYEFRNLSARFDANNFYATACSLHQINALTNMPPEVQAKKIATIQKTLKAARSKVWSCTNTIIVVCECLVRI